MRSIVKYTFIVLVVFLAGCAGTEEYKAAQRHLEKDEYDLALSAFKKALEQNPDFAEDKAFQERLLAAKRDRAKQLYNGVLFKISTSAHLFTGASISLAATTVEDLERSLEEAASLDPHNRKVQYSLRSIAEPEYGNAGKAYTEGIAYYDKKDWYRAKDCFARAINLQRGHIPALIKSIECKTPITKADKKFQLGTQLVNEKRLAGATAALKESLAISLFHPEAGKVLEAVEKRKAKAQDFYRKGLESTGKEDWSGAEKAFAATMNIWSDYQEARQGFVQACIKQVDAYERQSLAGHALLKCVMAMETIPGNGVLEQRSKALRDQLLDSVSCRVGLLVTDAGSDSRKAAKLEASISAASPDYWPKFVRVLSREQMKITGLSPDFLLSCKVLELDEEMMKDSEDFPRRLRAGRKQILNPDYVAAQKAYEQSTFGTMGSIAAQLRLHNTPQYIYEDVYETRHFTAPMYKQSAATSFSVEIFKPSTGDLIYREIFSDKSKRITYFPDLVGPIMYLQEKYGFTNITMMRLGYYLVDEDPIKPKDLLTPLLYRLCTKLSHKIAIQLANLQATLLVGEAKRSLGEGNINTCIENLIKALLIVPQKDDPACQEADRLIREATGTSEARTMLENVNLIGYIQYPWVGAEFEEFPLSPHLAVTQVYPNSPAERAGLQAGDAIRNCNGREFNTLPDFGRMIASSSIGEILKFEVERQEKTLRIDVEIGQRTSDL